MQSATILPCNGHMCPGGRLKLLCALCATYPCVLSPENDRKKTKIVKRTTVVLIESGGPVTSACFAFDFQPFQLQLLDLRLPFFRRVYISRPPLFFIGNRHNMIQYDDTQTTSRPSSSSLRRLFRCLKLNDNQQDTFRVESQRVQSKFATKNPDTLTRKRFVIC